MRVRAISLDTERESRQSFACVAPDARISHSSSRVLLRVRLPDIRTGQNMEVRSKALNRGGRLGFAECASRFVIKTTSAAEQSAGAAYSQSRRRELQLPAVFTTPRPASTTRIGRTCEPG